MPVHPDPICTYMCTAANLLCLATTDLLPTMIPNHIINFINPNPLLSDECPLTLGMIDDSTLASQGFPQDSYLFEPEEGSEEEREC